MASRFSLVQGLPASSEDADCFSIDLDFLGGNQSQHVPTSHAQVKIDSEAVTISRAWSGVPCSRSVAASGAASLAIQLKVMRALSACPPRQSAAQLVAALRHSGLDARLVAPKARPGGEPHAVATLGAGRGDNAAKQVAGRSVGAAVWCNGQPYVVVLGQLAGCAHGREQRLEQQGEGTGVLDTSLVVEPALQEIFATPLATAAYASAVSRLPQVWIGPCVGLQQLAWDMCEQLLNSCRALGLDLPPWRSHAAMMARWDAQNACQIGQQVVQQEEPEALPRGPTAQKDAATPAAVGAAAAVGGPADLLRRGPLGGGSDGGFRVSECGSEAWSDLVRVSSVSTMSECGSALSRSSSRTVCTGHAGDVCNIPAGCNPKRGGVAPLEHVEPSRSCAPESSRLVSSSGSVLAGPCAHGAGALNEERALVELGAGGPTCLPADLPSRQQGQHTACGTGALPGVCLAHPVVYGFDVRQ